MVFIVVVFCIYEYYVFKLEMIGRRRRYIIFRFIICRGGVSKNVILFNFVLVYLCKIILGLVEISKWFWSDVIVDIVFFNFLEYIFEIWEEY